MRIARCLVLFTAVFALAAARPAVAQVDADADGDGVIDSLDQCDALDDRLDDGEADDIGGGSCLGNPCAF